MTGVVARRIRCAQWARRNRNGAALKGTEMKLDCNLRKRSARIAGAAKRLMSLRGEAGDLLVEFAMTLPILIMILTGVTSFSLAFYSLEQLGNATVNAVQYVAADQGLTSDPCATAASQVTGALPGWSSSSFSYRLAITDSSGTTYYPSSTGWTSGTFSCTGGASEETENYTVVLSVKYAYKWLPILAFSPSSPLTSTQAAVAE
jgi:Flp pilus assembly protein TadG